MATVGPAERATLALILETGCGITEGSSEKFWKEDMTMAECSECGAEIDHGSGLRGRRDRDVRRVWR